VPHPEGGYYREIHRSALQVQPQDGRGVRCGLTAIYFLLVAGTGSRWHSVTSDEIWQFCEGEPLDLFVADSQFEHLSAHALGPLDAGLQPVRVVSAGQWQAARSRGAYTLVACTVGPGFDFADFRMLRDAPDSAAALTRRHPAFADVL